MLAERKEEYNRRIRDLGVLPEEAFEKYTNEKLDRVRLNATVMQVNYAYLLYRLVGQETPHRQRKLEEVCSCQQEGFRTI